jgi:hypothetical protein
MADTLLRPQRCSCCGGLRRKLFTLACRYICDRCLPDTVAELRPDLDARTRADVIARMIAELR